MNNFKYTKILLDDINSFITEFPGNEDNPIISYHLIKVGIITFSSEMENDLKEIFSTRINGYKGFCNLCNKLRNPKFTDINDVLKNLGYNSLSIDEAKISKYSNVMKERDKVSHHTAYDLKISKNDLKEVVDIAAEILTEINDIFIKFSYSNPY